MNIRHIIAAAGMALAALGLTAPAAAAPDRDHRPGVHRAQHGDRARSYRSVQRSRSVRRQSYRRPHYAQHSRYSRRSYARPAYYGHRSYARPAYYSRSNYYGQRRRHEWRQARYRGYGYYRRCHTEWRHHRRIRVCR